ncbi:hypothetical protein CRYUN_Cryun22dG0102400 [Craigia yunnanensis]
MADNKKQKHFVLVHGLCHGARCWYKLKPQLGSAGHRVTVLDLAASGINMKAIDDVHTFHEYTRPLLAFLSSLNEQAILVGHSFGGMNLALAMDLFTHKISFGVFVTAFKPDTIHQPSYVMDKKDLELAKTLVRPGSLFQQELSKAKNFSDEGYESVTQVFIVCDEDKALNLEIQRWVIQNNPPKDVVEIKGADHMAMFSKTKQLCQSLVEIANRYA